MQRFAAFLFIAGLLLLAACDGLSEINEDPNDPSDVPENLQLPALLGNFSFEIIGNEAARTPAQWTQQIAFNGTQPSEDTYDHDESDVNNLWEFFSYSDVMYNARILDSTATRNGNFEYAAIAKTLLAWNLSVVTDLWNQVPYAEAFEVVDGKIVNPTPAYDEQEAVYVAIFDLLNQSLADYDRTLDPNRTAPLSPGQDDLLYGGDMQRWQRLTYTLLARMHLHLTRAPGNRAEDRAAQALAALGSGFQSNADDADFAYHDVPGEENPWCQWTIDGKWDTRNQMSAHYVTLLKTNRDPRLPVQARQVGAVDANGLAPGFQPVPFSEEDFALDDPTYVGHQNGEEGIGAGLISPIGAYYNAPNAPLTWISYAEAKFIEAEATLITEGTAAADPVYRTAIAASMAKLGVAPADAQTYLDALPALADEDDALEALITEKYVANFLNLDVYNDWRRTGVPALTPITNNPRTPGGIIPLRFPYPDSELSRNAASVEATGVPLGLPALELRVWWDPD